MTLRNRLAAITAAAALAAMTLAVATPAAAQTEPPTDGLWDTFEPQLYTAYQVQHRSHPTGIQSGWLVAESVVPEGHSCPVWIVTSNLDDTGPHSGLFTGDYSIYGVGDPVVNQVAHALVYEGGSRIMFQVHAGSYFVIGANAQDYLCRFTFHHRDANFIKLGWSDTTGGNPFDHHPPIGRIDDDALPDPPPDSPFNHG